MVGFPAALPHPLCLIRYASSAASLFSLLFSNRLWARSSVFNKEEFIVADKLAAKRSERIVDLEAILCRYVVALDDVILQCGVLRLDLAIL
jgi:hypothetical protein